MCSGNFFSEVSSFIMSPSCNIRLILLQDFRRCYPSPGNIVSSWNSYSFISLGVFQGNIRRVCTSFNISKTIAVFVRICNQSSSTTSWYVCVCTVCISNTLNILFPWFFVCRQLHLHVVFSILLEFQFRLTKFVIAFLIAEPFTWVMAWKNIIPFQHFVSLLEKHFFPKWMQVYSFDFIIHPSLSISGHFSKRASQVWFDCS